MSEQQTKAAAGPPKIKAMTEAIALAIAQLVHDVDSGALKDGELVERTVQNLYATISFIGTATELAERIVAHEAQRDEVPQREVRRAAPAKEVKRRGSLSPGVTIQADILHSQGRTLVTLTYRGTRGALIASGCLTPSMIENKQREHRTDERGTWFYVHRSPTKAAPERMKLCCQAKSVAAAMQLPGVRELFPEGIPEIEWDELHGPVFPARAQAETRPATAREWKQSTRPSFLRLVVNNSEVANV
jgi:hypothetical protein